MISINMVGGGFQHTSCSSHGHKPKHINWVKDGTAKISIHIDNGIKIPTDKNKINYGWLTESKTIIGDLYSWCVNNVKYLEDNFELVFTHDITLLALSDKFKLTICSAKHWITNPNIYNKSKLISMIASSKVLCDEHIYRQKIISKYRNDLDLFGRGFNPIKNKDTALDKYHYSVAMENGTYPLMYSEKITDCFATGTIPIYYGTDLIGDIFNVEGIIKLDENLNLNDLTPELYNSKLGAIKDNYQIVMDMPVAEDYIYENYIR